MSLLDVRAGSQQLGEVIRGTPRITDQLNSVCRTLEIPVIYTPDLKSYLGDTAELWINGTRWFVGQIRKISKDARGNLTLLAYDPLYFLARNPDDFYFKNMSATQIIKQLAKDSGVKVGKLENTVAALQPLYYKLKPPSKIAIDVIARTFYATNKKYWYRYEPDIDIEGLILYERLIPPDVWAFQVGVNLVSANTVDSIEAAATVIKLVNRETGRVVLKVDQEKLEAWGPTVHAEEVDKNDADDMDRKAADLVDELSRIQTTIKVEGINTDAYMGQFYSGDVVYVEEQLTGLLGAYHIINATQTFIGDDNVILSFDLQHAPDVPVVQYSDATKLAGEKEEAASSVSNSYSDEVKEAASKYGVEL